MWTLRQGSHSPWKAGGKLIAVLFLASSTTLASAADSMSVSMCVELHERIQVHRLGGRFLRAQSSISTCLSSKCPQMILEDCESWELKNARDLPSLVVIARQGTHDIALSGIWLDDVLIELKANEREIDVDPGEHTLRVRPAMNSPQVQSRHLIVLKGEQGRIVEFTFGEHLHPVELQYRPIPQASYWLGGATVVALALGATLGAVAVAERNRLMGSCSPYCSETQKKSVDKKLMAADISWGVALATGVGTVLSYWLRPTRLKEAPPSSTTTLFPEAGPNYGGVKWTTQF